MIKKINRQEFLGNFKNFPHLEENTILEGANYFYPQTYASYTLSHKSRTFKEHVEIMSLAIANLSEQFGLKELYFMPNEDSAWIKDAVEQNEVMQAIDFLLSNHIDAGFAGCIMVEPDSIATFFKHVMNLSYYCNSFPMINYTDKSMIFVSSICSLGNVHVEILNPEIHLLALDAMEATELDVYNGDVCESLFNQISHTTTDVNSIIKLKEK